jgi:hypothetical protein
MTVKIVAIFESPLGGWSEVYYNSAVNPDAWMTPGTNPLVSSDPFGVWTRARLGLLSSQCFLSYVRVSLTPGFRLDRTYEFFPAQGRGSYKRLSVGGGIIVASRSSVETYTSLLLKCEAGFNASKRLYLGGIPEDVVVPPQIYSPTPEFTSAYVNFQAVIQNGSYQIASRPPAVAAQPIASFVVSASGRSATITPGIGVFAGNGYLPVVIRGVKYPRGWNGVHQAFKPSASVAQFVIGPTRKPQVSLPPWDINAGGSFQIFYPLLQTIDRVTTERLVERKRGRFFGEPVGRRS